MSLILKLSRLFLINFIESIYKSRLLDGSKMAIANGMFVKIKSSL